jgi:hypothetical protein
VSEAGAAPELGQPEKDLWKVALVTASNLSFQFSPSTASRVLSIVIRGVQDLRGAGSIEDPSKLAEAQRNLEKLVREMAREATENRDKRTAEALRKGEYISDIELRTLHDRNLDAALMKLCPGLWPIC